MHQMKLEWQDLISMRVRRISLIGIEKNDFYEMIIR